MVRRAKAADSEIEKSPSPQSPPKGADRYRAFPMRSMINVLKEAVPAPKASLVNSALPMLTPEGTIWWQKMETLAGQIDVVALPNGGSVKRTDIEASRTRKIDHNGLDIHT